MPFPLLLMAAAGVVADPCAAEPTFSPELTTWRTSVYAKGNKAMIPPPVAAATAYRAAYVEARKQDWADLCHYHADNLRLQALPPAARQVVFMGDSITEAWAVGDPALFQPGWIDRGVSGQTTPQMLVRFPQDVLALHPRVVHIMAGTNDIAGNTGPTTLDAIEGNIAAMVTLAKAAGIRVVLAATPPSAGFKWSPELKPAPIIAALNARLKGLAEREKVEFVDYGTVLATPDGALKPGFSLDGTHPNADGYAAIAPLTRAAVAKAER
jgi:acyl-CoA thioesterase I